MCPSPTSNPDSRMPSPARSAQWPASAKTGRPSLQSLHCSLLNCPRGAYAILSATAWLPMRRTLGSSLQHSTRTATMCAPPELWGPTWLTRACQQQYGFNTSPHRLRGLAHRKRQEERVLPSLASLMDTGQLPHGSLIRSSYRHSQRSHMGASRVCHVGDTSSRPAPEVGNGGKFHVVSKAGPPPSAPCPRVVGGSSILEHMKSQ